MEQQNDLNKKLLYAVIGLSAVVLLGVGVLIGIAITPTSPKVEIVSESEEALDEQSSEEMPDAATQPVAETAAQYAQQPVQPAAEQTQPVAKREKTYGYYPSFYVKRTSYTVPHYEGMHYIDIHTDGSTRVKKAWTDKRWLEEEDIEDGDYRFHVKENDDRESRTGTLYLKDNYGRTIQIRVTQRGER